MNMNTRSKVSVVTALLALVDADSLLSLGGGSQRKYLDRNHCSDCGADVGPGRPGRRCVTCRNPVPTPMIEFVQ